jgi:hypothetical protein
MMEDVTGGVCSLNPLTPPSLCVPLRARVVAHYPSTAGAGEVAPKGSEGVGEALKWKESLGSADALRPLRPLGHLPRFRGGGNRFALIVLKNLNFFNPLQKIEEIDPHFAFWGYI